MRKAFATVLVAGAALAFVVPGTAFGVSVRCGTTNLYSHPCAKPKIQFKTPKVACVKAGPRYQLPNLSFDAQGGIRMIRIRMERPPRAVWFKRFTARYPRQRYSAKHIHVNTLGLTPGAHILQITLTDAHRKSVTRTIRFAICQATPVFTG